MTNEQKSLNALKNNPNHHVYNFPPAQTAILKRLNHQGVWKVIAQDPNMGPMVKLVQQDVQNLVGGS